MGFAGVSSYGWENGDPKLLFIGWDSDGNGCGYSESTKEYEYLYWPEPPSPDLKEAVLTLDISKAVAMLNYGTCVKECPKADSNTIVDCKITSHIARNTPTNYSGCEYKIRADYFQEWGLTGG